MGIGKVSSLAAASLAKVNSLVKLSINKINAVAASFAAAFTDDNAVAKSISTGVEQAVYIASSDGSYIYDHNDAFTVSFWVKAGWSADLNTSIHLFSSTDVGAASAWNDLYRIYYTEQNNRLNVQWGHSGSGRKQQFWYFHDSSGMSTAYNAAGLGTSYWSAANRGNTGDDDYTLITVTRGTSNSAAPDNLKLYWNATDCGTGYYASGGGSGTPSMGNNDKQIFLGSNSWSPNYNKSGDSTATKFNGVTIWNKVLSSAEVTELYNSGEPMNIEDHTAYDDCAGWWNFESDGSNEIDGGPDFDQINGESVVEAK